MTPPEEMERYKCETLYEYSTVRGDRCHERAEDLLRTRVTRLESALRTIADTHGPGTLAGDAAREGMKS